MKALLKGTSVIQKAIDSVARRGKGLDNDIQLAGLSILAHINEHKDSTLADRLVNALGKGARRLALVEWFVAHGMIRVLDKSKPDEAQALKDGRLFKFDATRKTDMAGAQAKQWHEFKKEADVSTVFDAQGAVMNLLARIKSSHEKGMTIEGKAEALAQIENLRAALTTE